MDLTTRTASLSSSWVYALEDFDCGSRSVTFDDEADDDLTLDTCVLSTFLG